MMLLEEMYLMLRKNIEEDKIMDMTNLVTKATLNAKTNEVKGEMRSITNSATKTTLNAVENKYLVLAI